MLNQSLIQPFTDAFVAAVDAATPGTVFVTDGPPPASLLQAGQVVWTGDVSGNQTTIGLGSDDDSGPKDEAFALQVHISIYGATTADARNIHTLQGNEAFQILETINATVRANPDMGLNETNNPLAYVKFVETRGPVTVRKGGNDNARETTVSFVVFVFGFLERAS